MQEQDKDQDRFVQDQDRHTQIIVKIMPYILHSEFSEVYYKNRGVSKVRSGKESNKDMSFFRYFL